MKKIADMQGQEGIQQQQGHISSSVPLPPKKKERLFADLSSQVGLSKQGASMTDPTADVNSNQGSSTSGDYSNGLLKDEGIIPMEDDEPSPVTEIESLCMNCGENGVTRLLLTRIPFFKEIILMAFSCPHCHFSNNEVQSASSIAEQGIAHTLRIQSPRDLSRQVVKSEHGSVRLVEADFEIPASAQRGILTTVEGLLTNARTALESDQPYRQSNQTEVYEGVERVLKQLTRYIEGQDSFTLVLRDPSGNSFVEPLTYPIDPTITTTHFDRSAEENESMGYSAGDADAPPTEQSSAVEASEPVDEFDLNTQVHVFPGNCSRCNAPGDTKMHMLDIPHFKQVIIMSTVCDVCGYKSNEVKAGGAISSTGHRITLRVTCMDDLSRDVLKSETCRFVIPEMDLELGRGTLGGRFSTLEGILTSVIEDLEGKASFVGGDSAEAGSKRSFEAFIEKLKGSMTLENGPFHVILDDPLGNSYIQNLYAPDPDPEMQVVEYERTYEQNEDYGLNDIQTENYAPLEHVAEEE